MPDKSKKSVEIEAELIVLKENKELNEAQLDSISGGVGASAPADAPPKPPKP
jgi:bacteriocin-like protein